LALLLCLIQSPVYCSILLQYFIAVLSALTEREMTSEAVALASFVRLCLFTSITTKVDIKQNRVAHTMV